jgi:hypothetical protein
MSDSAGQATSSPSRPNESAHLARRNGGTRAGRALQMMPHQESASETAPRSIYDPGGQHHWGGQRRCSKRLVQCGECVELRSIRGAGPAATGTRRLAGPRREAQDELGCGRGRPALGRTSGLDMCCAARGPSSPRPYCSKATILGSLEPKELAVDRLGLTNNARIKHCRASHLAACGHTVLPKIGPVIALRRRTDYQFSPLAERRGG